MQLRREKGLCFTFDEKFSPSHWCPNKQYLILQTEEVEEGNLQPDPQDKPNNQIDHSLEREHHLSFNSLKGASGIGTMRFQGNVNGMQIQILLDSGSSDNFLQPRLAHCKYKSKGTL